MQCAMRDGRRCGTIRFDGMGWAGVQNRKRLTILDAATADSLAHTHLIFFLTLSLGMPTTGQLKSRLNKRCRVACFSLVAQRASGTRNETGRRHSLSKWPAAWCGCCRLEESAACGSLKAALCLSSSSLARSFVRPLGASAGVDEVVDWIHGCPNEEIACQYSVRIHYAVTAKGVGWGCVRRVIDGAVKGQIRDQMNAIGLTPASSRWNYT
ncbi:hypothetical protein LZ31DRAFT_139099 [Colletotrichum somersetense]|nr:hypothetical protein LZ31DRAFT_139099 [Colletotrichum somersetense]